MNAMPMNDEHKRRRARNIALAVVLFALVVLFYSITIVRMGGGAH
ncbi:MAG: hypothetical protein OJJ21_02685 [Ferrovibrio sp.]|nr:hypothetical protein [Ferrovibrio sp.]MCW0232485.1 hypothetical protein [Ferrovibrio sp.]